LALFEDLLDEGLEEVQDIVKDIISLKGVPVLPPQEVIRKVELKRILVVGTEQHHASHDDTDQPAHVGEEGIDFVKGAIVGDRSTGLVKD
jgi:hypothetical protein